MREPTDLERYAHEENKDMILRQQMLVGAMCISGFLAFLGICYLLGTFL